MGLDAFVHCNCFKEGRTAPPPIPIVGWEDGEPVWERSALTEEQTAALDGWMQTACPHPNREYLSLPVANWGAYRLFQQALGEVGWEHFPVLAAELPQENGGSMAADAAAQALAELTYFHDHARFTQLVLMESETGERLRSSVNAYGGAFVFSPEGTLGFDRDGFYIQAPGAAGAIVFRARRFEQRLHDPEAMARGEKGLVTYHDLERGTSHTTTLALPGGLIPWPDGRMQNDQGHLRTAYPRLMHVETHEVGAERVGPVLHALIQLCQAAVETGNPVHWC